jgi:Domain of unknown function (DUF3362)
MDPFTKKPVYIAKAMKERKMQRALMQFFKPENYFEVREALRSVGRTDLIGDGCDSLIPSKPPREAVDNRRKDANKRFRGDYVHTIPGAATDEDAPTEELKKGSKKQRRDRKSTGYRPKRPGAN